MALIIKLAIAAFILLTIMQIVIKRLTTANSVKWCVSESLKDAAFIVFVLGISIALFSIDWNDTGKFIVQLRCLG